MVVTCNNKIMKKKKNEILFLHGGQMLENKQDKNEIYTNGGHISGNVRDNVFL